MSLVRVSSAEPYREYNKGSFQLAMGSFGDARNMLFQQSHFPHEYDPAKGDRLVSAYSDRLLEWFGREHHAACLEKHREAQGNMSWFNWMRSGNAKDLLAFSVDLLKATDPAIVNRDGAAITDWTGFRICGGVNMATGYNYWTFEVFSKGPGSKTMTYSGENAPNVPVRHDINGWVIRPAPR